MNDTQRMMGPLLFIGTLLATLLVCIGAMLFLKQHGHDIIQSNSFAELIIPLPVWQLVSSGAALGIIQLGLLSLLITQIARVALLAWSYAQSRDTAFMLMSSFILGVLLYSLWCS